MKELLTDLDVWLERAARKSLAVLLDYDGTLAEIVGRPSNARMTMATKKILQDMSGLKEVRVAVISGRALSDLKQRVPVKGVALVGSHGLESSFGGQRVSARYVRKLAQLRQQLTVELRGMSGVVLEPKPFSLAIHYRLALPADGRQVQIMVQRFCAGAVAEGQVQLLAGKKVIEIMPPVVTDKGQAVKSLLRTWGQKKFLPIFIGDDRTDESAFKVLRGQGLTIKVAGPDSRSSAEYYLPSVNSVRKFLTLLVRLKGRGA
jgi:trehalose-phosphatase